VDDARIEKLISRLRLKLEPDPAQPLYISTVRGRGYKLNTPGGLAADAAAAGDNLLSEQ
jgi:DNA-binding response OmpR family regulator